jgi:hypothetical protein
MVAEACQDTGHVYTTYNGYGDITIQSNDCDPPIATLITITDPWSNNHTDQIMSIGTIKTFTSGSEVYTVEMTDMFCGVETTWSDYTECWWTEDGNRYVKTSGSNSTLGNSWANAWLTMGYGFQNIPSGKDLYVEEGLYGGETLSNMNPPQTMKMYIQSSGHTEAVCKVVVSDDSVINEFTAGNTINTDFTTLTLISLTNTYSNTFYVYKVRLQGATGGFAGYFKLKSFTSDATTFYYVDESDLMYASCAAGAYVDVYLPTAFKVNSGEHLSVYGSSGAVNCRFVNGGTTYWKSGDITTDTLKSAMSTYSFSHGFQISGF